MLQKTINQVRRNHALEHAVVTIMLEEGIRGPLGGYSTPWGFFIIGKISTQQLTRISQQARTLLASGQSELAISPHCGTNIAVGALISGTLTRLILGKRKQNQWKRLPLMLCAIAAGALLSRPIGNAIQRRYTTLPDINGLQITSISKAWPGDTPRLHRITTHTP